MKISVRTTHYTNDNSPQLRGYATVKFDDSYVLESVKIMERQDSNEIFIALPSLMVRTKDNRTEIMLSMIRVNMLRSLRKFFTLSPQRAERC